MQKVFIKPIDKFVSFFELIIYINFALLVIGSILNIVFFFKISNVLNDFEVSLKASYLVESLCEKYRMAHVAAACNSRDVWAGKLKEATPFIQEINDNLLNLLKKYSTSDPTGNEIVLLYSDQMKPEKHDLNIYQIGYMVDRMSTFITSSEYDFNQTESVIFDTSLRFFVDNEKENFKTCLGEASDIVLNDLNNKISIQLYIVIGTSIVTTILYIISTTFGLNPLLKLINKIQIEVLRMFRHIPTEYIDDLINKIDEQTEIIYLNFNVADDNKSSNKKDDDALNSKNKKNNLRGCYIALTIFIICGAAVFIPTYLTESRQTGMIDLLHKASKRLLLVRSSFIYTLETKLQDRMTYLPGESERLLESTIDDLKTIQYNIRYGKYKAAPSIDIDYLHDLLLKPSCKRKTKEECDARVYNHDIGYTENISNLPLDDLISHYISVSEAFITNNNNNNSTDFYDQQSCNKALKSMSLDKELMLQSNVLPDIIDGLTQFDHIVIQQLKENNTSAIEISIIFLVICFIINIGVYKVKIKSVMNEKKDEMNDLITLAFMIPRDVINKVPPYKKFIETGETNED